MTHFSAVTALLFSGALSCTSLLAAENMSFYGTLIEPPACSINDGQRIEVDFGDRVGVNKVDGVNYRQPVNYRITCDPGSGWSMLLTLSATASGYDNAALATSVDDLGIRILQNGAPMQLNRPYAIGAQNPPLLEAIPVKRPGSSLKEGAFEATATLQVMYQ